MDVSSREIESLDETWMVSYKTEVSDSQPSLSFSESVSLLETWCLQLSTEKRSDIFLFQT